MKDFFFEASKGRVLELLLSVNSYLEFYFKYIEDIFLISCIFLTAKEILA